MTDELTDERFSELFGFCILRPSKETIQKADEINALFDALSNEVGIESLELFTRAGKSREEHRHFLSNVASCPEDVLSLGRMLLAPDSDLRKK